MKRLTELFMVILTLGMIVCITSCTSTPATTPTANPIPTTVPTEILIPTTEPTTTPTTEPTMTPTEVVPTDVPEATPTIAPTLAPTEATTPTLVPTKVVVVTPTTEPTATPTLTPTPTVIINDEDIENKCRITARTTPAGSGTICCYTYDESLSLAEVFEYICEPNTRVFTYTQANEGWVLDHWEDNGTLFNDDNCFFGSFNAEKGHREITAVYRTIGAPTPTPTPLPMLAPDPYEILATVPYGENIVGTLTGDGTLTLSGTGTTYDYSKAWTMPQNNSEKYDLTEYTNKISKIVIEEGITEIGGYALAFFRNCRELVLPKSLTTIGKYAFWEMGMYGYWTDKRKTDIKGSKDRFYLKINLAESNVKEIKEAAFRATTLEDIILPETLEVIEEAAFYECQEKEDFTPTIIPSSVKRIDNHAFDNISMGADFVIKGKSSWDDFESVGYSDNPNYSDPESPHYSEPNPIWNVPEWCITFEP